MLALLLLAAQSSYAVVLESDLYPIRVECDDAALAAEALAVSEAVWEEQVVGMGFAVPLMRDDAGEVVQGFDLYLGDLGSSLATFSVRGDNPATPHTDCPVRSKAHAGYMAEPGWLSMSVAHLLNHASLHAVDCLEPQMPAFDFFTDAVEVLTGRDAFWDTYVHEFQAHPEEAVDAWFSTSPKLYYQFGAALFVLYLDEAWGDGDGTLIAATWARTAQDGTITSSNGELAYGDCDNEPDFLDAIAAEVESRGGTFDEAFHGFTEWRWFVGERDDGAHFADGAAWTDGLVAVAAEVAADELPVVDAGSDDQAEYSSSYVWIHAAPGEDEEMVVSMAGDPEVAWAASLLVLHEDAPATVIPLEGDETLVATVAHTPGAGEVVLAVSALADTATGTHDADAHEWRKEYGYTWSVALEPLEADTGADGSGGCGCAAPAAMPIGWPTLLLLPFVALGRGRRRTDRR